MRICRGLACVTPVLRQLVNAIHPGLPESSASMAGIMSSQGNLEVAINDVAVFISKSFGSNELIKLSSE